MLFRLINPSDPYTFKAPSIEIAGVVAYLLSPGFGAECLDKDCAGACTPVLFGWEEWFTEHDIDSKFANTHASEVAEAFDSFLIGDANDRADVESMLALIPDDKKKQWRDERQDRHRSSLNQIGEVAYQYADLYRKQAQLAEPVS